MPQDSYRTLAQDIIKAVKAHVELQGGQAMRDASMAHCREWQSRLDKLDRECTRVLHGGLEPLSHLPKRD
jgi:hypothetical protein